MTASAHQQLRQIDYTKTPEVPGGRQWVQKTKKAARSKPLKQQPHLKYVACSWLHRCFNTQGLGPWNLSAVPVSSERSFFLQSASRLANSIRRTYAQLALSLTKGP
jgi:hypothetical protein